jgi:hypothetical protein
MNERGALKRVLQALEYLIIGGLVLLSAAYTIGSWIQ